MIERQEDAPAADQGNVGQQVEQKIRAKYEVEAIDEEYGDELEFDEPSDGEDSNEGLEEEESKVEEEKKEGESDEESDDNDGNMMSTGFQLETIIKDNYRVDEPEQEE